MREFQSFYFDDERMLRPINAPKGRVLVSGLMDGTPEEFDASPTEDEPDTPSYTEEDPTDSEAEFNFNFD